MASQSDRDIDRLVEMIAERVQARLGPASVGNQDAASRKALLRALPARDRGDCITPEDGDCETCGACVVRRPWSVRAVEDAGATRVAAAVGVGPVSADLAKLIDHTLLKPEAVRDDVVKLCEEARKHQFASVCVNSHWVPLAKAMLAGSGVMVCAVVGFPLGAMSPSAKAYEAREAVRQGASEIDMVINLGALKSKDYETVFEDICRVVKAARPAGVKVILETGSLDDEEKIIGCTLSKLAGAAFVKTSTGFGKGGATVEDIALMRRVVGGEMGVKASGGVRSTEDAQRMAVAGANRIGASASVAIVLGTAKDSGSAKKGASAY
jgi:deoxyribose-phosphate aldolase